MWQPQRLILQCFQQQQPKISIFLFIISTLSLGIVVFVILHSVSAVVMTDSSSNHLPETTAKALGLQWKISTGLQDVLSTIDDSNSRIRGLLDVLRSAKQERPQWPEFLTLHRGATPPPANTTSCIVTAYFRVKNKYTEIKYEDEWMGNLLSVKDCMVIFCQDELVQSMMIARQSNPTVVLAMKLADLPIASYFDPSYETSTAYWEHQLQIDPEQRLHKSYQLFWIWLSKTWFVTTAGVLQHRFFDDEVITTPMLRRNVPSSLIQTWMWVDIGSFRNNKFSNQQLIQYPECLLDANDPRTVVWMAHHTPNPHPTDPYWNQKLNPDEKMYYYHSGSHGIATTVEAWVHFYIHFVETLDEYAKRGLFVGEDQCVLQSTCLLHPETCAYLPFNRINDHRYFGLRSALRYGNKGRRFELWRPPPL